MNNSTKPPKLVTVMVAAERLSVSPATVRRLCHAGKLHAIRTEGNHRRITEDSINAHIAWRERRSEQKQLNSPQGIIYK